jgi:hypothetical protein
MFSMPTVLKYDFSRIYYFDNNDASLPSFLLPSDSSLIVSSRQVLELRNLWAHRHKTEVSMHGVDGRGQSLKAKGGLRKLLQILQTVMHVCVDFVPDRLHAAAKVTLLCIQTLENIDRQQLLRVDLFSMTTVFFERALVRYRNACVLSQKSAGRLHELAGGVATLRDLLVKFPRKEFPKKAEEGPRKFRPCAYEESDLAILSPFFRGLKLEVCRGETTRVSGHDVVRDVVRLSDRREVRDVDILCSIASLEDLLDDHVDLAVLQPLFEQELLRRPDPLAIITPFMEERCKVTSGHGREYGQLPFFLVKLARNKLYHGKETPKDMALIIAASIESAMMIKELNVDPRKDKTIMDEDVRDTLIECDVLISWLTSPFNPLCKNQIDIGPLLEAAADHRYALDSAVRFQNHLERLRRIVRNEEPFVSSFPRLFTCRPDIKPDFDRLVQSFPVFFLNRDGYRNPMLLRSIREYTGIEAERIAAEDVGSLDRALKDWLFRRAIPETEKARCSEYSASHLLGSQLAWCKPKPLFRTRCESNSLYRAHRVGSNPKPTPFGFDLNSEQHENLQKIFKNRFQLYSDQSSAYQINSHEGGCMAIPYDFQNEKFNETFVNSAEPYLSRFDFISMLLMMGSESELFDRFLKEPFEIADSLDDIGSDDGGGDGSKKAEEGAAADDFDLKKPKATTLKDKLIVQTWTGDTFMNVYDAVISHNRSHPKALDALALRLRDADLSDDPTVLADMSFKLQKGRVRSLADLNLLSDEDMEVQVKDLNLNPLQFQFLVRAVRSHSASSQIHGQLVQVDSDRRPQAGGGVAQQRTTSMGPSAAPVPTGHPLQQPLQSSPVQILQPSEDLFQALNEHNLMMYWDTVYLRLGETTLAGLRKLDAQDVEAELKEAGMPLGPRKAVSKLCSGSFFGVKNPVPDTCQIQ